MDQPMSEQQQQQQQQLQDQSLVLKFCKMHGCANDFVIFHIDNLRTETTNDPYVPPLETLQTIARSICDRTTGVGADQVLVVTPPPENIDSDYQMLIFNSDGSVAESCANGIRCIQQQHDFIPFFSKTNSLRLSSSLQSPYTQFQSTCVTIYTLAGVQRCVSLPNHTQNNSRTLWVKVSVGKPSVLRTSDNRTTKNLSANSAYEDYSKMIQCGGHFINSTLVSMGNPHCVLHLENVEEFPMDHFGKVLESHPIFPYKTNVEFAQVKSRDLIRARVWQRGCGVTSACGTGAAAVLVSGVLRGKNNRRATVEMDGGDLEVEWREEDDEVFVSGPAVTVFEGSMRFYVDEFG
eukprot:gene3704-4615_t